MTRKRYSPLVRMICLFLLLAAVWPVEKGYSQSGDPEQPFLVNSTLPQAEYRPGEILVRLKPGAVVEAQSTAALAGATRLEAPRPGELELWEVPAGEEEQLAAQLQALPQVEFAEPNYLVYAFGDPNDPGYENQWGYTQVNSAEAWNLSTGSSAVIVAVIDTGIDESHPDLAGKLVPGYDFVQKDNLPHDLNGHGTHVAGVAAAQTNNALGVAGMSWGARIMPIRVLNANGEGTTANIISAIDWSVKHGAKIINLSFGNYRFDPLLQEAITSAYSAGVLVVAAAGNDGTHAPTYPAAYEHVLSVGATDKSGKRASYSNVDVNVDVLAPGGAGTSCEDPNGIYSTFPDYQVTLTSTGGCPDGYAYLNGTSFASPAAAGLAALVWSLSPGLGPGEVSQVITSTAVYLGSPFYNGYGRIDALAAAQAVSAPSGTPLLLPISNSDQDGSYQVEWVAVPGAAGYTLQEASDASFSNPVVRYSGPANKTLVSGQAAGRWYYRVRARLSGSESAWSQVRLAGVVPAAPEMAGVENASQTDEYTLSWTPVPGASGYALEESSNPDFSGARLKYRGLETSYRVTGQPGGTWYYRVRAYNLAGSGSWSAGTSTVVSPSPLEAPSVKEILNDDRDGDFSLFWNDISGAAGYLVERSRDPYFSRPEPPILTGVSQLSVTGIPGGIWYVRVRAVSSAGNSPWSSPVNTVVLIHTSLPILLSGSK